MATGGTASVGKVLGYQNRESLDCKPLKVTYSPPPYKTLVQNNKIVRNTIKNNYMHQVVFASLLTTSRQWPETSQYTILLVHHWARLSWVVPLVSAGLTHASVVS